MIENSVKCESCGQPGSSVFIDVFVRDGKVLALGCYGSTQFDGQLYEIVGNARNYVELGPWCDECLRKLVDSGEAIKLEDGRYFGLGAD